MKLRAETVRGCTTGSLLMKTTDEDLSNACKDGKRVVVETPN
jgi:hypothetical protein